jgi:hypothetical protein
MDRRLVRLVAVGSYLLLANLAFAAEQAKPDGSVKIKSRSVSPGIGLSWGDGVLTYKGQDYPFTFQAKGLFRDVDAKITATELSGEVFNLKRPEIFNGTYHKVEGNSAGEGRGSRATIKNSNGVTVKLASSVEGRQFNLSRDGISITLEKSKR